MNDLYKDDPEQFLGTGTDTGTTRSAKGSEEMCSSFGYSKLGGHKETKSVDASGKVAASSNWGSQTLTTRWLRKRIAYQTLAEQSPYMKSAWAK